MLVNTLTPIVYIKEFLLKTTLFWEEMVYFVKFQILLKKKFCKNSV